jgi:two-component system, OmpR family, response regulator
LLRELTPSMKILLVEDDEWIAESLVEALQDRRYAVDTATDGLAAWELIQAFPYDLAILDLMLPKLDGVSLCQRLRQANYAMPILMLTAKDTALDKVMGLDAGADDYLVKPFDLSELLARVRALLRRQTALIPAVLEWGKLRLNPATGQADYAHQFLSLTPKEFSLLEFILRSGGCLVRPEAILNHLWPSEDPPGKETIKVHLRGLRQKLRAAGADYDLIETVYGLGYRLKSVDEG